MTYDINHKVRIKDLKSLAEETDNLFDTLDERTTPLTWDTAAIRNSIARGQNLGEFTATHLAEIKAGTFRGMWLGDYFTVNSIKYVIAGFLYFGDFNHSSITLVRESKNMTYNTSENPYAPYCESEWYTNIRPTLIEEIETAFGADNIPEFGIYGTASYGSDGTPDAWVLLKSKLHLPTYSMIMGEVWSPYHHFVTSGHRNTKLPHPFYYTQLPLFAHSFKPAGVQYVMSCVSDVDGKNNIIIMLDKNRAGWPYGKTGQFWMAPVFHVGHNDNLGWSGW